MGSGTMKCRTRVSVGFDSSRTKGMGGRVGSTSTRHLGSRTMRMLVRSGDGGNATSIRNMIGTSSGVIVIMGNIFDGGTRGGGSAAA